MGTVPALVRCGFAGILVPQSGSSVAVQWRFSGTRIPYFAQPEKLEPLFYRGFGVRKSGGEGSRTCVQIEQPQGFRALFFEKWRFGGGSVF
jgi:hypothetical protein